jgi:hypothetical protein
MREKIDPKEWADDFKEFLNAPEVRPPTHIRDEVFRVVHRDLNPEFWFVMAKLGGIHAAVGSLSLLLCSQFGMGRGDTVMNTFMGYGMTVCMIVCGALFLGLTTFVAGFILSNSELKKMRRTAYSPIALMGVASLVVFFCFGADIALGFALAWLFGAILAGVIVTEATLAFRQVRHQYA